MDCVFCRILQGNAPAAVVLDRENVIAFLDSKPLFPGHCLVVPRKHLVTMADASPEEISALFATARELTVAVERALSAEGSFVAVNNRVSQSVPHLHIHVVPRTKGDGLRGFFWPRQKYRDDAHFEEVRQAIAAAVETQLPHE